MANKPVSAALFGQHAYVTGLTTAQVTFYQDLCGAVYDGTDLDTPITGPVLNTQMQRQLVLVQNGSGTTIEAGTARVRTGPAGYQ